MIRVIFPPSCCIPALSLGVLLQGREWGHKDPTPCLISLSHLWIAVVCTLSMVLCRVQVLFCWTLFSAYTIQLSPRVPWWCARILMTYDSLGAVSWGRAGNAPRSKMHHNGIDNVSLGRNMTGLTAKLHGPPPSSCTLTAGLNSQNTLKDQLYVWLLPPPLCKPHSWPLQLAEGACSLSLSLAHWKIERAIISCCKSSHLFSEVTFNTH